MKSELNFWASRVDKIFDVLCAEDEDLAYAFQLILKQTLGVSDLQRRTIATLRARLRMRSMYRYQPNREALAQKRNQWTNLAQQPPWMHHRFALSHTRIAAIREFGALP